MKWFYNIFFLLIAFILFTSLTQAQNNKKDLRISPKAEVMQTVGFTEVRIVYSRPGVKGELFGVSLFLMMQSGVQVQMRLPKLLFQLM